MPRKESPITAGQRTSCARY